MKFHKVEKLIRTTANNFGLDIKRFRNNETTAGRISHMLAANDIDLVLDIGANTGQYASSLRQNGYANEIISFEPLSIAWETISALSKNDANWKIYERCAIGKEFEFSQINISSNSVSSSLLDMLDTHLSAAPTSEYIGSEKVNIITLDSLHDELNLANRNFFVKIDTQGSEEAVIAGGKLSLMKASGIQIELSLVPLYNGQKLFFELLNILKSFGFELWSIFPGFTAEKNGRMLQVDAVLFKDKNV